MRRKPFDVSFGSAIPLFLVPAASDDPLAGLRFLHRVGDHVDDFIPRARLGKIQDELGVADADEVGVSFDEPGNRGAAFELDDFGVLGDVFLYLRGRTDSEDAAALYREGIYGSESVVDRHDVSVEQHEVSRDGGLRGGGGLWTARSLAIFGRVAAEPRAAEDERTEQVPS